MENKNFDLFISYRRDDTAGHSRSIKKELEKNFEVFFDVDSIEGGDVFPSRLEVAIENSKIILAIIGEQYCDELKKRSGCIDYIVEELKYAYSCKKTIIPVLINDLQMPDKDCIPNEINFLSTLSAIHIRHSEFDTSISKLKTSINSSIEKTPLIQMNFDKADKLLNIYPWKELIIEEKGSIKYQYWACGKKEDPYNYLILFPSTKNPTKAIDDFISKITSKQISKSKNILTILKNANVNKTTLNAFEEYSINYTFLTYQEYYWKECIPEDIKKFQYELDVDEYYIEQNLYRFDDLDNQKPIGKISEIVMEYIKNDDSFPVMAIIAQAGTGKTTFIEYIIDKINHAPQLQCIFISSEKVKKKFSNANSLPNIESIYQLYEYCDDSRRFDEQKLMMGITNGAIIVVIDGLEEIIALFAHENKFNSASFFNSLVAINNELGKCKVIVTSRESIETNNDFIKRDGVLVYKLKGFDDNLVDLYLNKRFGKNKFASEENSKNHIKKAKKYIENIKHKINNNNKIIPYILDLVCESVEEEMVSGGGELSFEIHNEYLSNHDIIDSIVYSYFFERELTRQTYPEGFKAKDLANIFIGFAVELGWVFSKEKMIEKIGMIYSTQYPLIVSNIEKSPLIQHSEEDESFKFKYDFLMNYFLCLFLIQEFGGKKSIYDLTKVLAQLPNEIIDDFKKYFKGEKTMIFMENAKIIHKELIEKIKQKQQNNYDISTEKSAIANLIYLLIKINSESLSSEKNINLLKELYGVDTLIKGLYIHQKFVPLDFSNMEIWDSDFSNYDNFFKSKFKNTKFFYSSFREMRKAYNNEPIWEEIRFDTCELGDIKTLILKEDIVSDIKKVLTNILSSIQDQSYTVKNRDEPYIDRLIFHEMIKVENNTYKLLRNGKQFIQNGRMSKNLRLLIDDLLKQG